MKVVIMFNSTIVLNRIVEHKCLFGKLEKDLKLFIKIYAHIQFR